jgi:hypothetical protein
VKGFDVYSAPDCVGDNHHVYRRGHYDSRHLLDYLDGHVGEIDRGAYRNQESVTDAGTDWEGNGFDRHVIGLEPNCFPTQRAERSHHRHLPTIVEQ